MYILTEGKTIIDLDLIILMKVEDAFGGGAIVTAYHRALFTNTSNAVTIAETKTEYEAEILVHAIFQAAKDGTKYFDVPEALASGELKKDYVDLPQAIDNYFKKEDDNDNQDK